MNSLSQLQYAPNYNSEHLYEPLRNALKKSALFQQGQYRKVADNSFLRNSRVAKTSRSLSSSQAEHIQASINFLNNKTLVPTKNFEKIKGKTYKAVDVEQREKQPMSYDEFLRVRTSGHQQIVYEVQEESEINKVYTYTTANTTKNTLPNSQSNQSFYRMYEDKIGSKPHSQNYFVNSTNSQYAGPYSARNHQLRYPYQHIQQSYNAGMRVNSHSKVTGKPLLDFKQQGSLPQQIKFSINQSENQIIIEPHQAKPYKFKKHQMMNYDESIKNAEVVQTKANLFNMFDGCLNNGCNSSNWQSNEFCASKIRPSGWK